MTSASAAQDGGTPVVVPEGGEIEFSPIVGDADEVIIDLRLSDPTLFGLYTVGAESISCQAQFANFDWYPDLIIYDLNGGLMAVVPLTGIEGTVGAVASESGELEAAQCRQPVHLPRWIKSSSYRVVVDPVLDVEVELEQGGTSIVQVDPLPEGFPDASNRLSGQLGSSDTYRLAGTLEIRGSNESSYWYLSGLPCSGLGENQGIEVGAQLLVFDQNSTIVGTALMEDTGSRDKESCEFLFSVDVPRSTFYSFSIAGFTSLVYSHAELEAQGWQLELVV